MEEIWKDIKGCEGYQVSNFGRVRHITITYLKPAARAIPHKRGQKDYVPLRVSIKGKKYAVHRLVADAFIINPFKKPFVNHKDGDTFNNSVDNLEWVSAKENTNHAIKTGLRPMKVPYKEYDRVCEEYQKGRTMNDIASDYGVHDTRIRSILIERGIHIRRKGSRP